MSVSYECQRPRRLSQDGARRRLATLGALIAAAALCACAPLTAPPAGPSPSAGPFPSAASVTTAHERAGREIAETYCAACHATGRAGVSPNAEAPPFRTLSQRYPVDNLAEAFAEGLRVGHPAMPEFRFEADQVDEMIAYLKSIQTDKAAPAIPGAPAAVKPPPG